MGSCLEGCLQAHEVNETFSPCSPEDKCGGNGLAAPENSKRESLEQYLLYAGCILLSLFTCVKLFQWSLTQVANGNSVGSTYIDVCPGLQGLLEAKW